MVAKGRKKMTLLGRRLPRWFLVIFVFLDVCIITAVLWFFVFKPADAPSTTDISDRSTSPQTTEDPGSIRMLATGDFIAHDAINAAAKQSDGSYSYASMMQGMKAQFAAADINFCNLATLAGGEAYGISGYPIFNAPLQWNKDMYDLGCNLINTGTNHTNDKGQGPITAQLDEWDTYADVLAVAGANRSAAEQNKVRYFDVKGVRFAFLSYSTYSNSPNPNPYSLNRFEEPLVSTQMQEARAQADIVIVSMRWGTEYSDTLNAAQNAAAEKLAGLGADIVLGHGTHTLQPIKKFAGQGGRETLVWFGLGNFVNAQLETGGLTGCVADIKIDVASKKVSDNSCLPFYQHYEWSAADKAAERLLNRRNFQIVPLYNAQELMAASQLDTTVDEQMERIRKAVNTFTEVPVQNAMNQL